MENANPFVPTSLNGLRAKITQELNELRVISAMIDSRLENIDHTQIKIPPPVLIEQLLNDFIDSPDMIEMDDLESDNESIDTPLVSLLLDSDDELDDGKVLDGDDLSFPCPEYQLDEDIKEWLTRGHVILDEESPEVLWIFIWTILG
ncbi:hypothetical protein Tco_1045192 [Tanacetum coccineum]|uniref:Uncharacterized protein n=1 Tax=Tanacetum coccineum TaxID=301880 RepID=A0ABQ5GS45_9ASTR